MPVFFYNFGGPLNLGNGGQNTIGYIVLGFFILTFVVQFFQQIMFAWDLSSSPTSPTTTSTSTKNTMFTSLENSLIQHQSDDELRWRNLVRPNAFKIMSPFARFVTSSSKNNTYSRRKDFFVPNYNPYSKPSETEKFFRPWFFFSDYKSEKNRISLFNFEIYPRLINYNVPTDKISLEILKNSSKEFISSNQWGFGAPEQQFSTISMNDFVKSAWRAQQSPTVTSKKHSNSKKIEDSTVIDPFYWSVSFYNNDLMFPTNNEQGLKDFKFEKPWRIIFDKIFKGTLLDTKQSDDSKCLLFHYTKNGLNLNKKGTKNRIGNFLKAVCVFTPKDDRNSTSNSQKKEFLIKTFDWRISNLEVSAVSLTNDVVERQICVYYASPRDIYQFRRLCKKYELDFSKENEQPSSKDKKKMILHKTQVEYGPSSDKIQNPGTQYVIELFPIEKKMKKGRLKHEDLMTFQFASGFNEILKNLPMTMSIFSHSLNSFELPSSKSDSNVQKPEDYVSYWSTKKQATIPKFVTKIAGKQSKNNFFFDGNTRFTNKFLSSVHAIANSFNSDNKRLAVSYYEGEIFIIDLKKNPKISKKSSEIEKDREDKINVHSIQVFDLKQFLPFHFFDKPRFSKKITNIALDENGKRCSILYENQLVFIMEEEKEDEKNPASKKWKMKNLLNSYQTSTSKKNTRKSKILHGKFFNFDSKNYFFTLNSDLSVSFFEIDKSKSLTSKFSVSEVLKFLIPDFMKFLFSIEIDHEQNQVRNENGVLNEALGHVIQKWKFYLPSTILIIVFLANEWKVQQVQRRQNEARQRLREEMRQREEVLRREQQQQQQPNQPQ